MRAFDVFREDYYNEFGIGANEVTPGNIRSLSTDNFDGRTMNKFKHINKSLT